MGILDLNRSAEMVATSRRRALVECVLDVTSDLYVKVEYDIGDASHWLRCRCIKTTTRNNNSIWPSCCISLTSCICSARYTSCTVHPSSQKLKNSFYSCSICPLRAWPYDKMCLKSMIFRRKRSVTTYLFPCSLHTIILQLFV